MRISFSKNRVELLGRIGKAETRFTSNNVEIMSLSLATTDQRKKQDGSYENATEWHNLTVIKPSEFAKSVLVKGALIEVVGKLQHNNYEDAEGVKRTFTSVLVYELYPHSKKAESGTAPATDDEPGDDNFGSMPNQEDQELPF